jgi:hypothetical protein
VASVIAIEPNHITIYTNIVMFNKHIGAIVVISELKREKLVLVELTSNIDIDIGETIALILALYLTITSRKKRASIFSNS